MTDLLNFTGAESGDSSEAQSTTGTVSVVSSGVITGTYSYRVNPGTTSVGNFRFAKQSTAGVPTTSFNVATLYHTLKFKIVTAPSSGEEEFYIVLDTGGSVKCYLTLTSTRVIKAYNNSGSLIGTGTTVLSTNTTYLIELQTSTGSGNTTFIVKINGTNEFNTTANQLTNNHGSVRVGRANNGGTAIDFTYDDLGWSDVGFIGDMQVLKMLPDSNGSTAQWTTGTGSSNYAEVDEIPTDGDTTYIKSSGSANDVHLVGLVSSATAGITGTIHAVKAFARIRENTDVTTATRVRIRSGSTNNDTASSDPTTTYANRFHLLNADPSTSTAWTTSALDSVEIGVKEDNAVSTRCTTLCLFVSFVPSSSVTSNIPAGSIVIAKQAPTTTLTNNKRSDVPSAAIHLTARAPTTTVTQNFVSRVPAGAINLNAQNPTTTLTANHVARIPVGAIQMTAQAPTSNIKVTQVIVPEARININANSPLVNLTGNFVSRPTSGTIVMTAFAPTTTLTANITANIPVATILLDPNDPTTNITGHFVGRIPSGQIHIHGQAPQTVITSGLLANIPVGELILDGKDPTTNLTHNFVSNIPNGGILLNSQAPTTVKTDNKLSYPPSAQIYVVPRAPTTHLSDNRVSNIPEGSIVFQGYNPSTTMTDNKTAHIPVAELDTTGQSPTTNITHHFVSRVTNAQIVIEGQEPYVDVPITRGVPLYTFLADTLVNSFTVEQLPATFETEAVDRLFYA